MMILSSTKNPEDSFQKDVTSKAALAVRIMILVIKVKNGERGSLYKTSLVIKCSEYREGIVLTALKVATKNNFKTFQELSIIVIG